VIIQQRKAVDQDLHCVLPYIIGIVSGFCKKHESATWRSVTR
jgi:hypothetical protein